MNRLAGISYKQLAELAERYPDENQGMSLVIVFMVPDESAKKKALSLCHFLDRQGIKAGLFFAGHQSVLSNRVEALARIRAAVLRREIMKALTEEEFGRILTRYEMELGLEEPEA